jgi:hypothetical protein
MRPLTVARAAVEKYSKDDSDLVSTQSRFGTSATLKDYSVFDFQNLVSTFNVMCPKSISYTFDAYNPSVELLQRSQYQLLSNASHT